MNLVTSAGYTCIFIAHEGTREFNDENGNKYSMIYPFGDKRIIDPICNLVDIIAYAAINNPDENGNEVKSSLYLKNTRKYHARSRFDYIVPYLKEFTAENLQEALKEAIKKQERVEGNVSVSFAQQQAAIERPEMSFDELFTAIKGFAVKMGELGKKDKYKEIVESHLGVGKGVQETTPKQKQLLELIHEDLVEYLDSISASSDKTMRGR